MLLVDVSANNPHPINWASAKAAGVVGAVVKITEDSDYINDTFAEDWSVLGQLAMVRGAYHFARPEWGTDPHAEAAYFINAVKGYLGTGDFVCLDIETPVQENMGDLSNWALSWLQTVTAALGFKPMIYSYPDFIKHCLTHPDLSQYPLWLAAYEANRPQGIEQWADEALWQYTWQGQVPGITGNVDEDYVANVATLRALGKPDPVPPTPSGPHYQCTTATNLRKNPVKNSAYVSPPYLLKVGEKVTGANTQTPSQTPHWRLVYIPGRGTQTAWCYLSDLQSIP